MEKVLYIQAHQVYLLLSFPSHQKPLLTFLNPYIEFHL